jgi:hypothetical protein
MSTTALAEKGQGKCASYPKLAAVEWMNKIFESDIETKKDINAGAITIEMKAPVLQVTSKNPPGVFESYVLDWSMRYKGKLMKYTATYLYDTECHRLRDAEFKYAKGSEEK